MASIDISDKVLAKIFSETFSKKLLEDIRPLIKSYIEEDLKKYKLKDKELLSKTDAMQFLGVGYEKFHRYLELGLPEIEIEEDKPKYSKTLILEFLRNKAYQLDD